MSSSSSKDDVIIFDGSNWESLPRIVTQAKLALLLDSQVAGSKDQSAWVAARFRGPALDWLGQRLSVSPTLLNNFEAFVTEVQQAFGVTDDGLKAHRRGQLEALRWQTDLPVFFAEFDRLTTQLDVNGNATRIALVRSKLPNSVQKLLSEQALDFSDYGTMRERLLTMWALDPNRQTVVHLTPKQKGKPRCGRCGKKGHTAPDCRNQKQ